MADVGVTEVGYTTNKPAPSSSLRETRTVYTTDTQTDWIYFIPVHVLDTLDAFDQWLTVLAVISSRNWHINHCLHTLPNPAHSSPRDDIHFTTIFTLVAAFSE